MSHDRSAALLASLLTKIPASRRYADGLDLNALLSSLDGPALSQALVAAGVPMLHRAKIAGLVLDARDQHDDSSPHHAHCAESAAALADAPAAAPADPPAAPPAEAPPAAAEMASPAEAPPAAAEMASPAGAVSAADAGANVDMMDASDFDEDRSIIYGAPPEPAGGSQTGAPEAAPKAEVGSPSIVTSGSIVTSDSPQAVIRAKGKSMHELMLAAQATARAAKRAAPTSDGEGSSAEAQQHHSSGSSWEPDVIPDKKDRRFHSSSLDDKAYGLFRERLLGRDGGSFPCLANERLCVRASLCDGGGKGLFAGSAGWFSRGDLVAIYGGHLRMAEECENHGSHAAEMANAGGTMIVDAFEVCSLLQAQADGAYAPAAGHEGLATCGLAAVANHAANGAPNTRFERTPQLVSVRQHFAVGPKAGVLPPVPVLVATRPIAPGDEITWSYPSPFVGRLEVDGVW